MTNVIVIFVHNRNLKTSVTEVFHADTHWGKKRTFFWIYDLKNQRNQSINGFSTLRKRKSTESKFIVQSFE